MSLLVVLALPFVLGGSIYRAHQQARSASEHPTPGDGKVVLGHRRQRVGIPDSVPTEWAEAYRSEQGS